MPLSSKLTPRIPLVSRMVLAGFLLLFAIFCLYPILLIFGVSFTDETTLSLRGYRLWPEVFSLDAYRFIFRSSEQIRQSYGVTVFITVVGTGMIVLILAPFAYVLSRPDFRYRGFFTFLVFFTMLFNGGLVPTYIMITQYLGLRDTIWVLILPLIPNGFYILVLRSFFRAQVPLSVIESARIDGASEFRTFFQIVFPLSIPGIGTIALFSSLMYWNDWFNALLYIDSPHLTPLQHLLMRIQNNINFLRDNIDRISGQQAQELIASLPAASARMALVVVSIGPIIFAYAFFQRFFRKGLLIGSLKG